MKILVSNDDGINALGIKVLHDLLRDLGHEVHVVAPEQQQSGMSHAITLTTPLITRKVYRDGEFFGLAVNGYPSDCVRLGLVEVCPHPDLIITGINLGNNVGPSIYYSGTVAGAFEGYLKHHRCFAMSLHSFQESAMNNLYRSFPQFLATLLEKCQASLFYNVNIPSGEIAGIRVTRQSRSVFLDDYEKRIDPRNKNYYWLCGKGWSPEEKFSSPSDFPHDIEALQKGYITVTPLQFDFTDYGQLEELDQQLRG